MLWKKKNHNYYSEEMLETIAKFEENFEFIHVSRGRCAPPDYSRVWLKQGISMLSACIQIRNEPGGARGTPEKNSKTAYPLYVVIIIE